MAKRVIVIASGETERRALPLLLRHLNQEGIILDTPVRTAPNGKITARIVRPLILSAWFDRAWTAPPDKFVVLADADGHDPQTIVDGINSELGTIAQVPVPILVTAAKWHLEAWFFADPPGLRDYLGRDLGNIDGSAPDEIVSPKNCLKNLLGEVVYTSRTAEEIAGRISPETARVRSPSFAAFERAVRNGPVLSVSPPDALEAT